MQDLDFSIGPSPPLGFQTGFSFAPAGLNPVPRPHGLRLSIRYQMASERHDRFERDDAAGESSWSQAN
jgi:hypothetical protein